MTSLGRLARAMHWGTPTRRGAYRSWPCLPLAPSVRGRWHCACRLSVPARRALAGVARKEREPGSNMDAVLSTYVVEWDAFAEQYLQSDAAAAPCIVMREPQYPGNVGMVMRNCGLLGFKHILILAADPGRISNRFLKKAVHTCTATHQADWDFKMVVGLPSLAEVMERFAQAEYASAAMWGVDEVARASGGVTGAPVWEAMAGVRYPRAVIVAGSEHDGLPAESAPYFDRLVYVPTAVGTSGCFNVGAAIMIACFEARRAWAIGSQTGEGVTAGGSLGAARGAAPLLPCAGG